jgi:uncharacterized membrane protein
MKNLTFISRSFFCIGMIGLGILQFYFGTFRPVFVPLWPDWLPAMTIGAYASGALFIVLSICILANIKAKDCALLLGAVLLIFLVLAQIPYMLLAHPGPWHLGSWIDPLKVLALSGSAFVVAGSFSSPTEKVDASMRFLSPLIPYGKIFFGLMMLVFGIDHFLYTESVASLVPTWIPGSVFWTDFAGVALIGTGVSIIFNIKRREVSVLAGIMLLLWVVLLHIPRTSGHPEIADKPNEVTSVFEALAFSGVSFLIAIASYKTPGEKAALG